MFPENDRLKKLIYWLISQGIVDSQEDMSMRLGYNPSAVSQIVTGKKPLSAKFAKKICSLSEKINSNYLLEGGEMVLNTVSQPFELTEKEGLLLEIINQKDAAIAKLNQQIGALEYQLSKLQK